MRVVGKYPISLEPEINVEMPKSARILTVQKLGRRMDDTIFLWAFVNPNESNVTRKFIWVGDGEQMSVDKYHVLYIATVPINGKVLHLFERLE